MHMRELSQQFVADGRIEAIYLRPARREPVISVDEVRAEPGQGLIGDHRASRTREGRHATKREITLIQAEHVDLIAGWLGVASLDPSRLRRNLVVSGLNLIAMRSPFADVAIEWALGDDLRLEITGPCDPCSRMEEELGKGGYNAMRGHGGVTARILVPGTLRVGDAVRWVDNEQRRELNLTEERQ